MSRKYKALVPPIKRTSQLPGSLQVFQTHDLGMFNPRPSLRNDVTVALVFTDFLEDVQDGLIGTISDGMDILRASISIFNLVRRNCPRHHSRLPNLSPTIHERFWTVPPLNGA